MTESSLKTGLKALFAVAGAKRRGQFRLVVALTLVGAIAELFTIGAVIPLLLLVADPDRAKSITPLMVALSPIQQLFGVGVVVAAAFVLALAAILATIFRLLLNWITQKFVYGLHRDLVLITFNRTLRQPYAWHTRQNSSIFIAAIEKVYLVTVGVISPLVTALSASVMVVMIGAFLLVINPAAALIAIAVVGSIYAVMTLTTRDIGRRISDTESQVRSLRIKALQEALGGIRDISLDQTHAIFEARIASLEQEHSQLLAQSSLISQTPRLVVEGAVILLVAALAVWFNTRPGGVVHAMPVLGALALGSQRLLPMVQLVYYGYVNFNFHQASIDDIVKLLNLPERRVKEIQAPDAAIRFVNCIEFKDVSFSYDGSRTIVDDVSLTIKKGERIGFIGKTGSGKSTLIDLVMGLLQPTSGSILIDGVALSPANEGTWKAQVAHVPQNIFLSDDTILANIAFGCAVGAIDADRAAAAAAQAGLGEFLRQLEHGLNSKVGERGIRLSGGQRQRIGIARALYKEASVLVLDEATSALDDATEAEVMDAVASLAEDLTIIMIAHRLSTVANCDRVYRLGDGRILDVGSYDVVIGEQRVSCGLGENPESHGETSGT